MTDTTNSDGTQSVEITRTFDAPASVVWALLTEADHFAAWYGPTGADVSVSEMDLRPGGRRFVSMKMETPNGPMEMWFTGEFREIVENERLVYTESMADAEGNVLSPSEMRIPEGHPDTTEVIVELNEDNGRTTMTMTHVGVPAGSPGAMGWNMAFDKLEIHVAAATA